MTAALIIQSSIDKVSSNKKYLMIRLSHKDIRIKIADIVLVEGLADYVIIRTGTQKYVTKSTMKDMCLKLPGEHFIRAHRSYIINTKKIHSLTSDSLLIKHGNFQSLVPIGQVFKKALKAKLLS